MTGGRWNESISQSRLIGLLCSVVGRVAKATGHSSPLAWGRKMAGRSFVARIDEWVSGWPGISRLGPLGRALESPWGAWLPTLAPVAALLMPAGAGVALTAVAFSAVILARGTGEAIGGLPAWLCTLAAASLIPASLSRLPVQSLVVWAQWVALLVLAGLAAAAVARVERRRLYTALSWLAILMGMLACAQIALGWGGVTGWVAPRLRPSVPYRSTGFFGNPNVFGAVINLVMWPLLFARPEQRRGDPGRVLRPVAVLALIVALLLTRSRAAFLGALFALVIWLCTKSRRRLPVIALAVVAFGTFLLLGGGVFGAEALAGATGTRWGIWRAALRLFAERPLIGQGPGTFAELAASPLMQPDHAHNVILQFLAETGLIGTVPTIWFFFRLGSRMIHHFVASADGESGGFVMGIGAALAAVTVQSLFDYPLAAGTAAMLGWVWAGFAWGASGPARRIVPGERQ